MKFIPFIIAIIILCQCRSQMDDSSGPFFGNGMHNGWADQNSIVIWTRLTRSQELNRTGEKFLVPSIDEMKKLDQEKNEEMIYRSQIPSGVDLEQMEGACPGSPGEVKLSYFMEGDSGNIIATEWVPVDENKNFSYQWKIENLVPGAKYKVFLEARKKNGSVVSSAIQGSFFTPPDPDSISNICFSIVTCHDYNRRDDLHNGHKIYPSMQKIHPDFFIHTGDIEYYDKPSPYALTEKLMRFKWDRIFALPYQREFYNNTTTYWMKDDHDALTNDAYPGMSYGTVSWERGLEIFDKEQFPSNDKPYKTIRWGKDLQIWIVEGRNYRSPNTDPDGSGKAIWGKEQKDWLFKTIKESDASFKLLITSTPILGPDRSTGKSDNYSNEAFQYEGDEIRNFLNQFTNVFICTGDRHWQYVSHKEGTNLWEFSCGAGSDSHAEGWIPEDVRPEHRFLRVKGGFLQGHVFRTKGQCVLKLQHCDVEGSIVHEEEFIRIPESSF